MGSNNYRLNSRASSATLSLRRQQLDGSGILTVDANIAQGLLRNQNVPARNTSLKGLLNNSNLDTTLYEHDASDHEERPRIRRGLCSSNTWTSSSGGVSDVDDTDDRMHFVEEFNRLAEKHSVRTFAPSEYETDPFPEDVPDKTGSWLSRKLFRRPSSPPSIRSRKDPRHLRSKRSISDSLRLRARRDTLKDRDLVELVRLCGSSLLYLPAEYAAGSLALPTCLRATAQYLIQHAPATRGVFRIPGSQNTVNLLYNHYCLVNDEGGLVAGTVRCPTLPDHIQCDVHDVASAFKKFLSGIPGGILGSLPLFDALVSIQTHLRGDPELTRTKHSKVRARLIALSIATLRSTYRRELICAVFGLLCMVGRAAETARREDDRGRPLPTSDLMGYRPLGIVFGPLLVGDLLENYNLRLADPHGSLVLTPVSSPKQRRERHKKNKSAEEGITFNTTVDKVKVANGITEMLITHWRDIVRHMKNLGALKPIEGSKSLAVRGRKTPTLRPSMSESFSLRKPPDWIHEKPSRYADRSLSPTPPQRKSSLQCAEINLLLTLLAGHKEHKEVAVEEPLDDPLISPLDPIQVRKQRVRQHRTAPRKVVTNARSGSTLSPAVVEEHPDEVSFELDRKLNFTQTPKQVLRAAPSNSSTQKGKENEPSPVAKPVGTGPRVKGIIKKLESDTIEPPTQPSEVDAMTFVSQKELNARGDSRSEAGRSKESKPSRFSLKSRSADAKIAQNPSPRTRTQQSSSKDYYGHIKFEPVSPIEITDPKEATARSPRRDRLADTTSSKQSIATDQLSKVSHEEDIASLAVLAGALDSPAKSISAEEKSRKAEQTNHDSGVNFQDKEENDRLAGKEDGPHQQTPHQNPLSKRPSNAVQSNSPAQSSLGRDIQPTPGRKESTDTRGKSKPVVLSEQKSDPVVPGTSDSLNVKLKQAEALFPRQSTTSATLSKVAFIREKFRSRKSPDQSQVLNSDVPDKSPQRPRPLTVSEPINTPKKVSVKAIADRFNAVAKMPLQPNPSPPPASLSASKSFPQMPQPNNELQKDGGLVSPYTINPPPSPSRSVASVRSAQSVRSIHAAALASRYQQAQAQAQAQASPTKAPAPKRVLREFIPDTAKSQTSGEEPPRPVSSLSIPLKSIGPEQPEPPATTTINPGLDGAYSSISSSDTLAPSSDELETVQNFLQRFHRENTSGEGLQVPTRGNRELYTQIQELQGQVKEETEEVRELQKWMQMRSVEMNVRYEIEELSEQVRVLREEMVEWRRRAVGAERKLEVLEVMSGERRGLGRWGGVREVGEGELGRGHSEDRGVRRLRSGREGDAVRNREARLGSDESAGSNGTVVRERGYSYTSGRGGSGSGGGRGSIEGGAKHNEWAKQTLNIMDSLGG
ncbi:GTPase activating Rga6 protein [Rutstroemia sp. NJR-2017a BBW]|nr:GTPase activating Rga6 protein [Rutstroemia sp. NJR-2017a BBW]